MYTCYSEQSSTFLAVFCHIFPPSFLSFLPGFFQVGFADVVDFQVLQIRLRVSSAGSLVAIHHITVPTLSSPPVPVLLLRPLLPLSSSSSNPAFIFLQLSQYARVQSDPLLNACLQHHTF